MKQLSAPAGVHQAGCHSVNHIQRATSAMSGCELTPQLREYFVSVLRQGLINEACVDLVNASNRGDRCEAMERMRALVRARSLEQVARMELACGLRK